MATQTLPDGLVLRGTTYHLRFMFKSVLITESTKTKNLREAERYLIKKKAELQEDMMLGGMKIGKLHAAMDKYLKSYMTEEAAKQPSYAITKFKGIEDMPLKKVESAHIEAIIKSMQDTHSEATIQTHISYWNAFCNWCTKNKYHTPPKMSRKGNVEGRTRWLTAEEQAKLLAALDPAKNKPKRRDTGNLYAQERHDFVVILMDTGLRFTEVSKMTWTQVDIDKKVLYVQRKKKGAPATLAMTTRVNELLVRRRGIDEQYILPKMAGAAMNGTRWMKDALARAGISEADGKISPHTLRHSFAAAMIQNGLALNEVQHLLGHANIQQTTRYAKFRKQDATDKAAAIMNSLATKVEPKSDNVIQINAA
jgi:integrase